MLRSVTELEKLTIGATDGTIGNVKDCYFDDEAWVIRYLVVATGAWLVGREVLISPLSASGTAAEGKVLHVSISKDQVRNSPSIDSQKPVSRQHEMGYSSYYGYPHYWGRSGSLGRRRVSWCDADWGWLGLERFGHRLHEGAGKE